MEIDKRVPVGCSTIGFLGICTEPGAYVVNPSVMGSGVFLI